MFLPALLLLPLLHPCAIQEVNLASAQKQMKSKQAEIRLEAIPILATDGSKKSGKALVKALKDSDYGVQMAAATALGSWETLDPTKSLVELAITTQVGQVRIAAARAIADYDLEAGIKLMCKSIANDDEGSLVYLALAALPGGATSEDLWKALEKTAKKRKKTYLRAGAAGTLHLLREETRLFFFESSMKDENLLVRIAAIEAVARAPWDDAFPILRTRLLASNTGTVEARRLALAMTAMLEERPGRDSDAALELASNFFSQTPTDDDAAWRIAVVARNLLNQEQVRSSVLGSQIRGAFLSRMQDSASLDAARATAAWALAVDAETDNGTRTSLRQVLKDDASPRVRRAAMAALLERQEIDTATIASLLDRIENDSDPLVRRLAAVAVGVPGFSETVGPLIKLSSDLDWQVAVVASVSLGKTRTPEALAALEVLCKDSDWRRRGAAVVGLAHLFQKGAIPVAIEMLADPEPLVARTAHEFLQTVTYRDFERAPEPYRTWWEANQGIVMIQTPEEARKRGREYADFDNGTLSKPYKEMDVFVYQSEADHIESLMQRREIQHSLTGKGLLSTAEAHPFGVFVSNCVGDCTMQDVEYLQWFVLTGGYLFSSCWALQGTVVQVEPGVMQPVQRYISGNLRDFVKAQMTVAASPYLKGVFEEGTEPYYALEGAHLIDVLTPERCEVLMDSPACAARWGAGDLAAWFSMGHGLMLDSANHFSAQGFPNSSALRKPEDRQAYAVNHMGLTLEDLRAVQSEKWWKVASKAQAHVMDESAFRFITNFVRKKRAAAR